ncbi:MAG: DNA adenine methylase [Dysosmobacter sp.]|jgi:DNA adenine methylase|uniref:DNA adenine methylase n=1 Tax=Dysosmobacter sp. TaxID=2591382 RepID=UPI003D8BE6EC
MRAVFRYPGSKWSIAKWIISNFPEGYEKMVYLEPFLGSGAVFFNKQPGAVETINDLDDDVVNLFQILRERPEDLKRALWLTPYSREEYDRAFEPCEDSLEQARRFMVRTTQAIGAKLGHGKCGWRNHKQMKIGGTACKWAGITETIDEAAARLKGGTKNLVQIEKMDALRLIERYNTPDALIYIDPPYVRSTRKSGALYVHEMTDEGQKRLLGLIASSRAKIIISGYDSEMYNEMLKGWRTDSTMSQTTSTEMAREKIWMNYSPPERQMTFEEIVSGG